MSKMVAIVIDSYDYAAALRMCADDPEIKELIELNGRAGGFTIFRPDSGDPVEVLPKMFNILATRFGFTTNDKGYRVLNNVRILWGDGINELSIRSILGRLVDLDGWSADNFAFGMGGALLQILNRDTLKFAMKASAISANGEWRDVFKDPITDHGKVSKKGKVTLWKCGSEFESSVTQPTRWVDNGFEWMPALREVFRDGDIIVDMTFEQVRFNTGE